MTKHQPIYRRKLLPRRAWYLYDWAISAFSTTVITVFLNPYLTAIAMSVADADGFVQVFGLNLYAASFFEYVISLSVILQVIILPLVGSIADHSKMKRPVLLWFTILGALATTSLFFVSDGRFILGGILLIIANVSCGTAMVIYNSLLSDVSTEEERDEVSARGYAIGYIGGGLLLLLNVLLYVFNDKIGISNDFAIRICLTSAGLWWGGFGVVSVMKMTEKPMFYIHRPNIRAHIKQLSNTFKDLRHHKMALLFLCAYLLFNDGVQAVIIVSGKFGLHEMGLNMSQLIVVILLLQFVAYFGATFFGKIANSIGSKKALLLSLFIWILVILYAYFFLHSKAEFYIVSFFIGLVLGGTQAISRSIYSRLIPKEKEAEYFSFYEISERGTSWMGPLAFGLALQMTQSYRIALLSLIIFFVVGTILLFFVKIKNVSPKQKLVDKSE